MVKGWVRILVLVGLAVSAAGCTSAAREATANRHYQRGQMLAKLGEYDAAMAELAQAMRAAPERPAAYAAAGDVCRRAGDYGQARQYYEQACELDPHAFRPHYNLGVTYQSLAQKAAAAERFDKYVRLAAGVYLRAVTLKPQDFETNLNLGACYYQLGKYDLAEKYCRDAIDLHPDSRAAYGNLGIVCARQGRFYEAIQAYKVALEIDVHQADVLVGLGSTYLRMGRLGAALGSFRQAALEAPTDPTPLEQIGLCHFYLGRLDKAQEAYEQALQLDGRRAEAHRGLGVVCMSRYLRDPREVDFRDRALTAWNASLEADPHQADLARLVRKYTPISSAEPLPGGDILPQIGQAPRVE